MLIKIIYLIIIFFSLNAQAGLLPEHYAYVKDAGDTVGIDPCLLEALIRNEGGKSGRDTKHPNGSVDTGLAQINKGGDWMKYLNKRYGITYEQLRDNDSVNILASAIILREEFLRSGDVIYAISAYHAGFGNRKSLRGLRYANDVLTKYDRLAKNKQCNRYWQGLSVKYSGLNS